MKQIKRDSSKPKGLMLEAKQRIRKIHSHHAEIQSNVTFSTLKPLQKWITKIVNNRRHRIPIYEEAKGNTQAKDCTYKNLRSACQNKAALWGSVA